MNEPIHTEWFSPPEFAGTTEPTEAADTFMLGRVIYWMLRGGRGYGELGHRSPSTDLVELLGETQFEAVNGLLDSMVDPADPRNRLPSMDLVITKIDETLHRFFGRGEGWCPACASSPLAPLGKLRQGLGPSTLFPPTGDVPLSMEGREISFLACPRCGRIAAHIRNTSRS